MKTHLECIPCFIKQSLEAAQMATDDKEIQKQVLKEVMKYLLTITFTDSPPQLSREVHAIIKKYTKNNDPYKKVKKQSNEQVKALYPKLKEIISNAEDPLLMAIKLAIVGNVIDFGTMKRFNLKQTIDSAIHKHFDDTSYPQFQNRLKKSTTILYLADNSGEIFFDKLLIEELVKRNKKVTYVVKANPIINDVLLQDAKDAQINKIATVIQGDAGQTKSAPGMVLCFVSDEFKEKLQSFDMVLSKGQGNYESLSEYNREIFFLLMIKCPIVAKDIGIEMGQLVLKVKK
jgi:damage-control phosphatase, subfamily I